MKKIIKTIINIVLIILIVVCSFKVGYRCLQYYKDIRMYFNLQTLKPNIEENINENSDEERLKQINLDYKFWITIPDTDISYLGISIPNTDISYPVVQGKDNEFYLYNNFYKEKSISGTIFIDYTNNIDLDKNIVIYGHNMKSNIMFNKINNFKKQENFNNGTIKIIIDNKEYIYEVFSVFVVNENYSDFRTNFTSDQDYMNYIDSLKQKSMYSKTIEQNNYNNILTLYTCSYEFNGARTIVCAVLK